MIVEFKIENLYMVQEFVDVKDDAEAEELFQKWYDRRINDLGEYVNSDAMWSVSNYHDVRLLNKKEFNES